MKLGKTIKNLRTKKKLTQLELANILHVSDRTISKWEQNRGNPDIGLLPKLSEIFDVSIDYLLTGKEFVSQEYQGESKLFKFISVKIAPYNLNKLDAITIEGLEAQFPFDYLRDCFLIAYSQVIKKDINEEEMIKMLISQLEKVSYARARPILEQKIYDLYNLYTQKKIIPQIEKNKFIRMIYNCLRKNGLVDNDDKIKYVENVIRPIVDCGKTNNDIIYGLKSLGNLGQTSNFTELKSQKITTKKALSLMEILEPIYFLTIINNGYKVNKGIQQKIIQLQLKHKASDSIMNLVISYNYHTKGTNLDFELMDKLLEIIKEEKISDIEEAYIFIKKLHKNKQI